MSEAKMYNIGIVDDEQLFRSALSMMVNHHEQLQTVIEAEHGKDLLEKLTKDPTSFPDLILCDIEMPIMNGVETVKALNQTYPEVKIVVLSSHYETALILKMLEIGASAFIPKNEKPDEFYNTIFNVIKSGFHYNNHVVQLIREKMLFGTKKPNTALVELSSREKEILLLICEQTTSKEIAEKLFISVRTVEGHRNNIINKTQAKNTAGIIIYAIENGLYKIKLKPSF